MRHSRGMLTASTRLAEGQHRQCARATPCTCSHTHHTPLTPLVPASHSLTLPHTPSHIQNHPKRESTGTGFVVAPGLILTNAHCVSDAT